jgi:indolepyruvate ferredoxin oxidoreductase
VGLKKKLKLGSWFRGPLRALASMKALRGTAFDIFGYAAVRREERTLIGWYEQLVRDCLERVTPDNLPLAQEIVALPAQIRGYENIKLANVGKIKALAAEKLGEMQRTHLVSVR